MKNILIGIIIIVIIVGGFLGWLFLKNKEDNSFKSMLDNNKKSSDMAQSDSERAKQMEKSDADENSQETQSEPEVEMIVLEAVGDYTGKGVASRYFEGGKFIHIVEADIPEPADGKFYEGWLVEGASFFSTGKMENVDGRYELIYESDENQSGFNSVVITEETEADGLDGKPEAHVLEGKFE